MERVNDLKEVNVKVTTPFSAKEISVLGRDSYGEYNFMLKNISSHEKISVNLNRSELKSLIIGLMAIGDFKEDDFKEKSYRYESPEFFGYSSSQTRFLYQNVLRGNIFLESEEKFSSFIDKDNYKNRFTDKEFESLLESNPEVSVLIKETVDIG